MIRLEEVAKMDEEDIRALVEDIIRVEESSSTVSRLSPDLAAEDAGWLKLGNQAGRITTNQREYITRQSRAYARFDGNCKQIVKLYTDFAVGTGFTWRSEDEELEKLLKSFWEDPRNRRIFSSSGQKTSSRFLLTNGEVFFVHIIEKGSVVTRRLDNLQVLDFIVNPDDQTDVWGYVRSYYPPSGELQEIIYCDWLNQDRKMGIKLSDFTKPDKGYEKNAFVQYVPLEEDEDGRSLPILTATLDWARSHRHFMRARLAVQQAIAMFASKLKGKGGVETLNRLLTEYNATVNNPTSRSDSVPPGSTWLENQAMDRQPIKQETGAESARVDGGMLLQMVGVGSGIFPHWFGSGESFRLATANAMEAPMARAFESYQALWLDEYRYMFEFVRAVSKSSGQNIKFDTEEMEELSVAFDAPEIQTKDIPSIIHSMNETIHALPKLKESRDFLNLLFTQLGMTDVAEVLNRYEEIPEPQPLVMEPGKNPTLDPTQSKPDGQSERSNLPPASDVAE